MRSLCLYIGAFALLLMTCQSDSDSSVVDRKTIGPEGGKLSGGGVEIAIPVGALTTELQLSLVKGTTNLSKSDFEAKDLGFKFDPPGTKLNQPATLTFDDSGKKSAVLYQQDELTIATAGNRAYLNELSSFALAKSGSFPVEVNSPELGETLPPEGTAHQNTVKLELELKNISQLKLIATAYDLENRHDAPLNGDIQGDCAFHFKVTQGGSLREDCTRGQHSALVAISSNELALNLEPFQLPKLESSVSVSLIAGTDELAYYLGSFQFMTDACFRESCSGHGDCVLQSGEARCECDQGYEADPNGALECHCMPQCEGRECGGDGCNGSCPPGCDSGERCEDGRCIGEDPSDSGAEQDSGNDSAGDSENDSNDDSGMDSGASDSATESTAGDESDGETSDSGSDESGSTG